MRIDFIETEPKKKKIKNVTKLIIITVLAILICAIVVYLICNNSNDSQLIDRISDLVQKDNGLLPKNTNNAKKRMENLYKSEKKIAYLTFDDGPSSTVTPFILDVLEKQNIKATFFVLGSNVEENPELVRRAYKEGHYIANHGYSHVYEQIYKSPESVFEEYKKTEKLIQKAIGNKKYSSYLFRFPGGYSAGKYKAIKEEAGRILTENDIFFLGWNALTGDSAGANTKEQILSNIKEYAQSGKTTLVVLMHDAAAKLLTYETLEEVIEILRNEGYTFDNFYSIMKE